MKKKLVGIITLIIVALLGGIFLVHESIVSNDSKDWKVYRNDEFGFEFKYPKNGQVVTNYDDDTNTLFSAKDEMSGFQVKILKEDNRGDFVEHDIFPFILVDWRIARVSQSYGMAGSYLERFALWHDGNLFAFFGPRKSLRTVNFIR